MRPAWRSISGGFCTPWRFELPGGEAKALPGGRALEVAGFEGGYDRNFCYLVWCPETRSAALVDAATPVGPIQEAIQEKGLSLNRVLLTHTHGDHLACLGEWLALYPRLEVMGHQWPVRCGLPNYRGVADGAAVDLGRCRLVLLETPGHYPDCVCWHEGRGGQLFSGDTVFVGRTGRTLSPASSTRQLYHSVYSRILTLPPETVVYPGHDYGPTPTTTLGELTSGSDFFRCTSAAQFEEVLARYERSRRSGD